MNARMVRLIPFFAMYLGLNAPGSAMADAAPLVAEARPLFATSGREDGTTPEGRDMAARETASLFSDRAEGGFFAPFPLRAGPAPNASVVNGATGADRRVAALLSLIAEAEAGRAGYDAVQYGAHIPPPRLPTNMTLGEIYQWIDATPGQPHAIGRYQFIPTTLHRVAQARGFGPETPFTPAVQDALALVLLEEAGLGAFENRALPRRDFMHNLARIWAGLPLPNGRSYYHGYAGNRATMEFARFEGVMAAIWPDIRS